MANPIQSSSHESRSREAEIQAYALGIVYQRFSTTQLHMFLTPAIVAYVLWGHVDHTLMVGWLLAIGIIQSARIVLFFFYRHTNPGIHETRRWGNYLTAAALMSGLAWGAGGVLFFVPGSAGHQVLLYLSILGIVAGSMMVTAYWLPGFYAFAIPALTMSAARLAAEGTLEYQGLVVLMIVFLAIVIVIGRSQKQSGHEAIRLRFENLDLVEQLREQKEVAEQANLAKSKFLAAASHDLRQPLHAMTLFADALEGRLQNPDDHLVLARLQGSLSAMRKLFNALLDISRLDAGIVEPRIKDIQLARLLDRLHVEYAPQAQEKNIEWRCLATEAIVRSDPVLLETLLRNLIGNAIRYTSQGYVAIACREVDGWARIEIEDSGVGIPAAKQADIFREYHQLNNPERDGAKGLGLGLAIVERLARLLDHRIELRSAPGEGSCFTVVLPLGSASAVSAEEDGGSGEETALDADLAGMVVLVIDDQAAVLEGMQALLGRWGCETILADSEEAAAVAAAAAQRRPELIIADYRLRADRTGSQAIDRVRRALGESIPALVVTGDTAPERLREAQASGHALMNKPVPPARLRAFLRTVRRNRATG